MGSGKSRVAEEFRRHGAQVISGDALGHEALRQAAIRDAVVSRWGPGVLDEHGEISRRRVAAIVFADPAELRALEAMVYPWIKRRVREEVAAARADDEVRLIVLDAAVMLEAGWDGVCDEIVFVDAPREARLERLARQRGWDADEVQARERHQMPLAEKARRARYTVDNSGPPEETARQVEHLLQEWKCHRVKDRRGKSP
jgi:dephospho-CoA kinase